MNTQTLFGRTTATDVMEACELVEQVSQRCREKRNFVIELDDRQEILVSAESQRFCDQQQQVWETVASLMPSSKVRIRELSGTDERLQCVTQQGRPLHDLLWMLSFLSSEQLLPNGFRDDDVISIRAWPNLTRLPGTPNIHRILALFTARPTSLRLARRILTVTEEEMYRAIRAAIYSGLAFSVNHTHPVPKPKVHRSQSLISQLMKRFSH